MLDAALGVEERHDAGGVGVEPDRLGIMAVVVVRPGILVCGHNDADTGVEQGRPGMHVMSRPLVQRRGKAMKPLVVWPVLIGEHRVHALAHHSEEQGNW